MLPSLEGKTLVKGIFRELAILGEDVRVLLSGSSYIAHVTLGGDATRNANETDAIFLDPQPPIISELSLEFELDGHFLTAKLTLSKTIENAFDLPEKILVSQKRSNLRTNFGIFSEHPQFVELRASGARFYGKLKDYNAHYVVLVVEKSGAELIPGQKIDLRAYSSERQTLAHSGQIFYVRHVGEDLIEIVIDQKPSLSRDAFLKRDTRWPVSQPVFLPLVWPDKQGMKIEVTVQDLGLTGFSGTLRATQATLPPLGALCLLSESNLIARIAWASKEMVGFDLRSNDTQELARWAEMTDDWRRPGMGTLPEGRQREQILKIMLRSGYLRGKKSKIFSDADAIRMIPNKKTRTWLTRFSSKYEGNETDIHISYLKLSDSSWMIQELGHITQNADGAKTITDSLGEFFLRTRRSASLSTRLIALYDNTSKFNRNYWSPIIEKRIGIFSPSVVIDLARYREVVKPEQQIKIGRTNLESWSSTYDALQAIFDRGILNGLGLTADNFDAPVLRDMLGSSGYQLQRQVLTAFVENKLIGAVVNFGLPTFANLSATANHLWILVEDLKYTTALIQSVFSDSASSLLIKGATEAVVLSSGANLTNPEKSGLGRSFSLLTLPVLSIPDAMGVSG